MNRRNWTWTLSAFLLIPLAAACGSDGGGGGGGGGGATDGGAGSGGATGGAAGAGGTAGGGGASGGAAGGGGASGGAGGSGGSSCAPFASVTKDEACKSYATEYCKLLATCAPTYFALFRVADEADCALQFEDVCKGIVDAPGTGVKPAGMAAYADLMSKLTCNDMYAGSLESLSVSADPSCGGPGSLAEGKGCYSDAQCASDNCDVPDNALCGKCSTKPGAGDACTFTSDCADGLYCDFNDTCVIAKKLGESCAGGARCEDGTYCSANDTCAAVGGPGADCSADDECESPLVCSTAGKCKQAALATAGADCDPDESNSCNGYLGFKCDKATLKCATQTIIGPGDACGIMQSGGSITLNIFCSGGASCVMPSGSNTGTCIKVAPAGGACNTDTGPDCGFGAECISGTCQVASGTTCPTG